MELAEIERITREILPEYGEGGLEFSLIEKGGSGRSFYRMTSDQGGQGLIVMHYQLDRSDNPRFAAITDFLLAHGVPAPRIVARREEQRLLWVEDLGEIDLGDLGKEDWETVRRPAYEKALRAVFPLHSIREDTAPENLPELERPFDGSLYEWEQGYFLTHYVERFHSHELAEKMRNHPSFAALARELATLPRGLVHRDFQSTNVMLQGGEAYLIDYQGLRWGLPEYDLASMIYDPYCQFSSEETEDLIDFYHSLQIAAGSKESCESYRRRLVQCALQRLMQALGAYGFLGEVKGKREFLVHIPTAKERLLKLALEDDALPVLGELL